MQKLIIIVFASAHALTSSKKETYHYYLELVLNYCKWRVSYKRSWTWIARLLNALPNWLHFWLDHNNLVDTNAIIWRISSLHSIISYSSFDTFKSFFFHHRSNDVAKRDFWQLLNVIIKRANWQRSDTYILTMVLYLFVHRS